MKRTEGDRQNKGAEKKFYRQSSVNDNNSHMSIPQETLAVNPIFGSSLHQNEGRKMQNAVWLFYSWNNYHVWI